MTDISSVARVRTPINAVNHGNTKYYSEASAETEADNTNADTNLSMEDLASSFMEKVEKSRMSLRPKQLIAPKLRL